MVLAGCREQPKPAVQVPAVTVASPQDREVTTYLEYTGTTQAIQYVDIRARVAGFLDKIHFQPDAKVKAGDPLFTIDPSQYQAAVSQNEAQLESNKAKYKLAKTQEEMWKTLESQQAASALRLEEKVANSSVTKADIDLAQAALDTAKLNLLWSRVVSPIDGRVSRNLVDVGNLVGATEKTLLTTVINAESVYCYFNMSQSDIMKLRKSFAGVGLAGSLEASPEKVKVFLGITEEAGYPHEGHIDYVDNKLNPSTGTIQVRGIFANADRAILAGMFGRVRVPLEKRKALVVPGTAVQFAQGGNYVLVVDGENVVQRKPVKLRDKIGETTVIDEGLAPTDRVIISGTQRARPGSKVNPSQAPAQSGTGADKKTEKK
jgi:membrane fusion protein, multidrug efflux system